MYIYIYIYIYIYKTARAAAGAKAAPQDGAAELRLGGLPRAAGIIMILVIIPISNSSY